MLIRGKKNKETVIKYYLQAFNYDAQTVLGYKLIIVWIPRAIVGVQMSR